ncbi:uncharacterized protein LOC118437732 [Folsomia candida]|uniref:uncharacterized protein LOC118437732 n=1 Tax=Folsomia candida TaxID=158441 RepID=UPI001604F0AE|nr:uncharacterized protein LOC118437732 [Folsomia candida]
MTFNSEHRNQELGCMVFIAIVQRDNLDLRSKSIQPLIQLLYAIVSGSNSLSESESTYENVPGSSSKYSEPYETQPVSPLPLSSPLEEFSLSGKTKRGFFPLLGNSN